MSHRNHTTPISHTQHTRANYKSVIPRALPTSDQPKLATALMKKWSLIRLVTGVVSRR
jgi:hypothetical protein